MRRRPNDIAGLHIAYSVIYTDPGKQNTPYSPLDLALPDALANLVSQIAWLAILSGIPDLANGEVVLFVNSLLYLCEPLYSPSWPADPPWST